MIHLSSSCRCTKSSRTTIGLLVAWLLLISSVEIACHQLTDSKATTGLRGLKQTADNSLTPGCTWDFSSKSCRMSVAHHAMFYMKVKDESLQASLFSVQDCTATTMREFCTNKHRQGCIWVEKCEPALVSGLELLKKCYGPASTIFSNICVTKSHATSKDVCEQQETSPGCVWEPKKNRYEPCSFVLSSYLKDLESIGEDPREFPRVTFSEDTKESIEAMVDECSNTGGLSCNLKQNCLLVGGRDCIPSPSAIMKLANVKREPGFDKICNLVDLVHKGECSIPTSKDNCDDLGLDCSWDSISGRCMPSPTLVFEVGVEEPGLIEEFQAAKSNCEDMKSRDTCEAITV